MRPTNLIAGLRLVIRSALVNDPPNLVEFTALLDDACDVVEETLRLVVNLGWRCDRFRGQLGARHTHARGRVAVDMELADVAGREPLATERTLVLHEMVETSTGHEPRSRARRQAYF